MKTIIAVMRDFTNYSVLCEAVKKSKLLITEIVSGGAKGVDSLGERYASKNNIPLKVFPADWDKHGVAAGAIRNEQMAKYAECLLAIWDGKSSGTRDMIKKSKRYKLKVVIYYTTYGEIIFNESKQDPKQPDLFS